jgi:hypothetical protein
MNRVGGNGDAIGLQRTKDDHADGFALIQRALAKIALGSRRHLYLKVLIIGASSVSCFDENFKT